MTKTTAEKRYSQSQLDIALITDKLINIEKKVIGIDIKLEKEYVTKAELKIIRIQLELVQKIVYGVVALVLIAVISGGLAWLISSPK